jgi:broad specificity phosphatase PhoE
VTRLILWRHGRTAWNAGRRIQGHADSPLDDLGREQAEQAAATLAERSPAAIVASDLSRVTGTAAALARLTGLPVTTDPRLRERDFGAWQGSTLDQVAAAHPVEYARWRAGEPVAGCGVEEVEELAKRVALALQDAAALVPDGTVVVVTHGGAVKHGLAQLLGWPPSVQRTLTVLDNCHWAELRHPVDRGWQLRAYNVGW